MSGIIGGVGSKSKIIDGSVGIGTSPDVTLQVQTSDDYVTLRGKDTLLSSEYGKVCNLNINPGRDNFNNTDGVGTRIQAFQYGGASVGWTTELLFWNYGSGVQLRGKFNHAGDFYTNDGTVSSLSDVRVKKDIEDLTDGLSIINQLKPRTFKYNGLANMAVDDDVVRYGFIADEVLATAPHYVELGIEEIDGEKVEDFKSLSTTRFIPMMVKAIQELSAKVTTLETANTALEARVLALESA